MTSRLSRRKFVTGLTTLAIAAPQLAAAAKPDVLVVGAGVARLQCSLAPAQYGSLSYCAGGQCCACTTGIGGGSRVCGKLVSAACTSVGLD